MDDHAKQQESKKLIIEIPQSLYDQLTAWKKQHGYVTDAEAVRSLIRDAIKSDCNCQEKSGQ